MFIVLTFIPRAIPYGPQRKEPIPIAFNTDNIANIFRESKTIAVIPVTGICYDVVLNDDNIKKLHEAGIII
jgi:hypothetical protein